jgi:hypothetical protein
VLGAGVAYKLLFAVAHVGDDGRWAFRSARITEDLAANMKLIDD